MRPAIFVCSALLLAAPAAADEVEDALEAALEAWREGDAARAREELGFAQALIDEAQAEGLAAFLPEPMSGWTREDGEATAAPMAMFGGGMSASATYARGNDTVELSLFADNPMVAAAAPMLASPQLMAAAGDVRRMGRRRYVVAHTGEVMALVGGRVLVRASGTASEADKTAYFEAIDFDGLEDF